MRSVNATRRDLPTGTVTFMFTDIEGSTPILRSLGNDEYTRLLERHNELIREVLDQHRGQEVATEGDAFFAVFTDPVGAVAASIEIHLKVSKERWADDTPLAVRIGLHTGNGVLGAENYVGVDVHRAQRIAASAHGGQVLLSAITAQLVSDLLPERSSLHELGKFRLAGFERPEILYQLHGDGLESEFPPPTGTSAASRLPDPLTDFVGRDTELERGGKALGEHRLLTLTGPGGTGKTRLSIELGRRAESEFDDGAYFVPLATIQDPDLIPATILGVIGLKTAGSVAPIEHLQSYLSDRNLLLILDNFEQLQAGASTVAMLLNSAPAIKVIITSRAPLRLSGEREIPVPPLAVPGPDITALEQAHAPGVQLFASRATAVRPDFELNETNLETISSITRSLDGLPLAIELAASRMRSLTPELILERLDNRLLSSTAADLPQRQQTIVNAIGWSYDMLDEPTRRLFETLSVFMGSFGLAEAERVCLGPEGTDVLDGLINLVESSMLQQTESSGEPRFRMLTVIRQYGYGALVARGVETEIQDRHAGAYLDLAEAADKEILTSRQGYWLDRLSADHDNLRAAFDHAIHHKDIDVALRMAGALWRFWQIRGHLVEGRRRVEDALALGDGGDPYARARALTALAGIRYWQGDWEGTLAPYEEALELFRLSGSEAEISEALYNLSFPLGYAGDIDRAEALLTESLQMCERIGRTIGVGRAHWGLADMAAFREDWDASVSYNLMAVEEFSDLDAPFDLGWAWFMVAHSYLNSEKSAEARPHLLKALDIFSRVRDLSGLTLLFDNFGLLALREGDLPRAARLFGVAHRLKADTGAAIGDVGINQVPEAIEFLANRDDVTEAAYREGYELTVDEALSYARGGGQV